MKTVLVLSPHDVLKIIDAHIKARPDCKGLKPSAIMIYGCQPVKVEIDNEHQEKPGW